MKMGVKHYIDLHMHSYYSVDGEFTPTQLVDQCQRAGISIMAIADHNTVRAIAEAQAAAAQVGIQYIPAVEIDCSYQGVDFHVLGYGIDYTSSNFTEIEESFIAQHISASKELLRLIRQLGFAVTEAEVAAIAKDRYWQEIWTAEIFAEVLLSKPEYFGHELLKPYRAGGPRSNNPWVNFYWDYCAQGKPCYVAVQYPSLEETIAMIKRNGGTAVLAHPGANLGNNIQLFNELLTLGLDGVEAGSNYHSAEMVAEFSRRTKAVGLLVTGGSDYHGKTKPAIGLGEYGCFSTEAEMEQQLQLYGLLDPR